MAEIASDYVSILPSAKGFGTKLESQVGGQTQGVGKKLGLGFGKAFAAGGALLAAAGVGSFLKGSLDEARESQKVGAQTVAVIKSTGGAANVTAKQVGALATAISNKVGIDDEAIQSGANLVATFTNIKNEAGRGNKVFDQTVRAATDMSVALGTDVKSSAIQLGKALNDPAKGYSKLQRSGVSFTDEQISQIKAMQKSGNLLGAQKIILGEVRKEFGGSAAAQATAGDKAKVAFDNLKESVGTALLPILDKLLPKLTDLFNYLGPKIGPALSQVGKLLSPVGAAFGKLFDSFSGGGASNLGSTLGKVGSSISTNFLPVLKTIGTTFVTSVLPAIGKAVGFFKANLLPVFIAVGRVIATQVVPIVSSLARFFVGQVIPAVIRIASAVGKNLKPVFVQLATTFKTQILPAIQVLLAKFREAQPTLQRIALFVLKLVGGFIKFQAAILGKVLPPLIRLVGFILGVVIKAIARQISVTVAVVRAFIRMGAAVGRAIGTVVRAVSRVVGAVIGMARGVGRGIGNAIGAFGRFAGGIGKHIGAAVKTVRGIPGKIKSALGNLGGLLVHAGEELINGLARGITNKLGAAFSAAKKVAQKIKDAFPGSPVKSGPLTSWNNGGAGKRLVGMLADGLGQTGPVDAAVATLSSRVSVAGASASIAASAASGDMASGFSGPVHFVDDNGDLIARMRAEADDRLHLHGVVAGI